MTNTRQKMSGGEAMLRAAMANGTEMVFGIPGVQTYPIFDAIQRTPEVKTVFSRHEQGSAYMAFGYAKATGRPGVYCVVPGPGVLNTMAALCTAWGGNTPVYCMTGQVPTDFLGSGRGHLHELPDQRATLGSLVKWAERIEDPRDTQAMTNEAFRNMLTGRPGPVSLEMCWDIMAREWEVEVGEGYTLEDPVDPDPDSIKDAARLIKESRRIMIMVGSGAQHASEAVLQLAELLDAPVTALRSGRGIVAEDHELGMSSAAAHRLWRETDLLIGIGSRLEMQYMNWTKKLNYVRRFENGPQVIRIDIDPKESDRLDVDVNIVTDAVRGAELLAKAVTAFASPSAKNRERIATAKSEARKAIETVQPHMAYLDVIRDVLPRDGCLVKDICQVGFTSHFGFPVYEPRTYVTSGLQGNLGFAYPTAVGVKVGVPDKAVVSIAGDGGFMFGVQELATAVQHNIGLVNIVFNNSAFNNVRRDQQRLYNGRLIGCELKNPDFCKLADSFGVRPYRVNSPGELKPALSKAIDKDVPALIEVICDRDTEVSPWPFIVMGG